MAEKNNNKSSFWKRAAVIGAVVLGGLGINAQDAQAAEQQPHMENNKAKVETNVQISGHTKDPSNSSLKQQILDLKAQYVELALNQKRFPAQAKEFMAQQKEIKAKLAPLLLEYKEQQKQENFRESIKVKSDNEVKTQNVHSNDKQQQVKDRDDDGR